MKFFAQKTVMWMILLCFITVANGQEAKVAPEKEVVTLENVIDHHKAFFVKYNEAKQSDVAKKYVAFTELEFESQDIIGVLSACEKDHNDEIKTLTQIKQIEALTQTASDGSTEEIAAVDEQATREIDRELVLAEKQLIECRLLLRQVTDARDEILVAKKDIWVKGLTRKSEMSSFAHSNWDTLKFDKLFPSHVVTWLSWSLVLALYLFLMKKSYFQQLQGRPNEYATLKAVGRMVLKVHVPVLALAWGSQWFNDGLYADLPLSMILAFLLRDAAVFLSFRDQFEAPKFHGFYQASTVFIVVTGLFWGALDINQNLDRSWLNTQAMMIIPMFTLYTAALIRAAIKLYNGPFALRDRMAAVAIILIAIFALVLMLMNYGRGAQYVTLLTLGLIRVYLGMKIVNGIRKVVLSEKVKKDQVKHGKKKVFKYPMWVTLLVALVYFLLAFAYLSLVSGVAADVYQQVSFFYKEGFTVGSIHVVPSSLLAGVIALMLLMNLMSVVKEGIASKWFKKSKIDRHARDEAATLVWYVGVTLSVLIGLSIAGLEMSKLAIIAGALSVGIGFGLQNIVSNFISGLIMMFEKPVKPGDWIEVGGSVGFVEKVKIRATLVKTFDNADTLVPNSEFLSNHVTNWTLGSPVGRVIVPIGVAYGSDTALVKQLLMDAALAHDQVLNNEKDQPKVLFLAFGASSLDFELRVMVKDITKCMAVKSDLHFAIDQAFRDAHIEIPFPQQDIHIKKDD